MRYYIHEFMKLINRMIGFRIWNKGEVPEVYNKNNDRDK